MLQKSYHSLLGDDAAVSPVIGVILMVGVTVILAAVIGSFTMSMQKGAAEPAPNAQFDFEDDGTDVTVIHDGGEILNSDNTGKLLINGNDKTSELPLKAGDEVVISGASGSEFDVVWQSPEGENSQILGTYDP